MGREEVESSCSWVAIMRNWSYLSREGREFGSGRGFCGCVEVAGEEGQILKSSRWRGQLRSAKESCSRSRGDAADTLSEMSSTSIDLYDSSSCLFCAINLFNFYTIRKIPLESSYCFSVSLQFLFAHFLPILDILDIFLLSIFSTLDSVIKDNFPFKYCVKLAYSLRANLYIHKIFFCAIYYQHYTRARVKLLSLVSTTFSSNL